MKKTISTAARGAFALAGLLVIGSNAAHAQFNVEEGAVERGSVEIEYHGAYLFGLPDVPQEALRQDHSIETSLGITDFWKFSVEAEAGQERDDDGSFSDGFNEIQLSNTFELLPLDEDAKRGAGLSLFTSYATTVSEENEESFTIGPIVSARSGRWSALGNLFFTRSFDLREPADIGGDDDDGDDDDVTIINGQPFETTPDNWAFNYALQLRYQLRDHIGIGVEAYGTIPDIGDAVPALDEGPEQHRIGPVLYVNFGGEKKMKAATYNGLAVRGAGNDDDDEGKSVTGVVDHDDDDDEGINVGMAFGVLFGETNETEDVALKWDVGIEF